LGLELADQVEQQLATGLAERQIRMLRLPSDRAKEISGVTG
jgi:hypothetical protein